MTDPHPSPPPAPATPPAAPRAWLAPLALALAAITLVGGSAVAVSSYQHMRELELQLARRIGEFDAASREARAAAQAANTALSDLQGRLMALETLAQETQNQQLALDAMYQELANTADERVVADIEQTLLLAQQQLQLAGNVRAALIGLEAADARLAQLAKPQFAGLRQAIMQDMARLKLMPAADTERINARLEALIQAVDQLKTEAEAQPQPPPPAPPPAGAWNTLGAISHAAWQEIKGLLRIRRLDQPEMPLLTPSQHYFLRENLKLRLLSARIAMLQRDEAAFRADLDAARTWVQRHFTRHHPGTQAFLVSLEELLAAPLALQDAQIQASLKAVQTARRRGE